MFFHAIILHDYRFFFEAPPLEELRGPNSSPRRGEVGRRTLRDYGGFLLPFFYRASFEMFTRQVPTRTPNTGAIREDYLGNREGDDALPQRASRECIPPKRGAMGQPGQPPNISKHTSKF